jgi:iron complex outermembrane receptor protein
MKNLRFGKLTAVLSLFAAYGAFATSGYSQQASSEAATANEAPQVLQKVVVTGSNIPMAADAVAVPVATIDSSVMDMSGVTSDTLDLLRKVAPNISGIGQENAQTGTSATFGGAQIALNGLPTLVLVDGRRVANDPGESQGGNQFVDLNMFSPAAIDHIEVLQDGASAIYGSDAIGGVVNIILKKNYNGWEVGAHYGMSTDLGHYEERSGYIVGGVSNDTTSIMLAVDYAQHDKLMESDRSYTNPYYGTYTYPGSLEIFDNNGNDQLYKLAPGVNTAPGGGQYTINQLVTMGIYIPLTADQALHEFNLAYGETLIGTLKRYSAMTAIEHKIFGDKLVGFANILAANTKTETQLNAQPLLPYVDDPYTDVQEFFGFTPPPLGQPVIPVTAPTVPFSQSWVDGVGGAPELYGGPGEGIVARARFTQYPRIYDNDSTLFRVVGGLRGDITPDIHWEMAADINRYQLNFTNPNLWDAQYLLTALADGQINPFSLVNPPSAFNGVTGTAFVNMVSTLNAFDAKIDGTPFTLPGGQAGFAVGVNYVREGLAAVPDINSLSNGAGGTIGWVNATSWAPFNAVRDVLSEFGEVSIPITGAKQNIMGAHSLNIDAAVRHDTYSGAVGSTTTPEASISWQPFDDQFKLRGSTGKSFIAPPLYLLYGPQGSGSTPSTIYTALNGTQRNEQFQEITGANPDLKPETAKSWSAGFVYTPKAVKGLSITVDYTGIAEKQVFGSVPVQTIIQDVETHGSASPYDNYIHYGSPSGPTFATPGEVSTHSQSAIFVDQNTLNLGGQKVGATDIALEYTWKMPGYGKFDINSVWTWYNSFETQVLPTEPYFEYTGTASTLNSTVPRWRTYTTFDWNDAGFDGVLGVTYISSVQDIGAGDISQSGFEGVSAFTTFDLSLSYDCSHLHLNKWLNGLKITVGCNNIADKQPPEALSAFGGTTNADIGTYEGAVGRMYYINGKYSF